MTESVNGGATCSTCRFWQPPSRRAKNVADDHGECRRRPPSTFDHTATVVLVLKCLFKATAVIAKMDPDIYDTELSEKQADALTYDDGSYMLWPTTWGHEWCGEHASRAPSESK